MSHTRIATLVFTLTALAGGVAAFWLTFRSVTVGVANVPPLEFPEQGFPHVAFETLLERFVTPGGRVRYQAWHDDPNAREALDRYLATLALYSPETTPTRFPDESDRLAYWLNAYNACVIKGVLTHWPIESVQDVKAPIEFKAGFGFFWRLRFVLGGREVNLYDLENKIIRKRFSDPRIHFVLNCASGGCPAIRPELPKGPALEIYLENATRDFLARPDAVAIDHDHRRITLSPIFEWYRDDFIQDLARRGIPRSQRSLVRWLQLATGPPESNLDRAKGYTVRFAPYDWSLNDEVRTP
jgi:hypothetical protein